MCCVCVHTCVCVCVRVCVIFFASIVVTVYSSGCVAVACTYQHNSWLYHKQRISGATSVVGCRHKVHMH